MNLKPAQSRIVVLWMVLAAIAACSEDRTRQASSKRSIVDGVEVVESSGLHADRDGLRLSETQLRIGVTDGADEYMIGQVTGLHRLSDGRILVADGLANQLRMFDSGGTHLRTIGRSGKGPEEFELIDRLFPYVADSVLVLDHGGTRLTVLSPDLQFARRMKIPFDDGTPSYRVDGAFVDGTILTASGRSRCNRQVADGGFCEDSVVLRRVEPISGDVRAEYGQFVSRRSEYIVVTSGMLTGWGEPHPQAYWTTDGTRLYYGDAKRFEVQIFAMDGALVRRIRVPHVSPRYGAKIAIQPSPGASDPRLKEAYEVRNKAIARAQMPDTFPAFSGIYVDDEAQVWIQEYVPFARRSRQVPRLFVFDTAGVIKYSVRSPRGLLRTPSPVRKFEPVLRASSILGVETDDDDVESIVEYRVQERRPK